MMKVLSTAGFLIAGIAIGGFLAIWFVPINRIAEIRGPGAPEEIHSSPTPDNPMSSPTSDNTSGWIRGKSTDPIKTETYDVVKRDFVQNDGTIIEEVIACGGQSTSSQIDLSVPGLSFQFMHHKGESNESNLGFEPSEAASSRLSPQMYAKNFLLGDTTPTANVRYRIGEFSGSVLADFRDLLETGNVFRNVLSFTLGHDYLWLHGSPASSISGLQGAHVVFALPPTHRSNVTYIENDFSTPLLSNFITECGASFASASNEGSSQ